MLPPDEQNARPLIVFDDRLPQSPRLGMSVKPPVLRRRTIAVVAALLVIGLLYATLVPFNFSADGPLNYRLTLTRPQPGDTAANFVVYIPLGIALRLMLRRRGSWWLTECAGALLVAAGISYSAEVLQQWLPGRVPTLTDTITNTAGAALGLLLAPMAQRRLRHLHAWLHYMLQTAPFTAAAGLLSACVLIYGLAPFDVHPSRTQLAWALAQFQASWDAGPTSRYELSQAAILNKWVAAAACGVLAFLLTMAAREKGRSLLAGSYHALSRSCCLVAGIELAQLFTASHVADWRDLARAWTCCGAGTLAAAALLWLRPLIYRDPAVLIGPMVPLLCPIIMVWLGFSSLASLGQEASQGNRWLPVMGAYSSSWNAVLTGYTASLMNYVLAVGAFAAWLRLRGQAPRLGHCLATGLVAALSLQSVAVLFFHSFPDTGHVALALLAGVLVHRLDSALFGAGRPIAKPLMPNS